MKCSLPVLPLPPPLLQLILAAVSSSKISSFGLPGLLNYFRCVCTVFLKYHVSFQLKKCAFFTDSVKYIGCDITPEGNCPAQSKFDLINNWPLPASGQSLISFIGLLTFYNIYCPLFEVKVKPLHLLEHQHHRQPDPNHQWTLPLCTIWDSLKVGITSSPCLARYGASNKPCFLKTIGLPLVWVGF
jgi:hypothetical protein